MIAFVSSCNNISHKKDEAYFDQVINKVDENARLHGKYTSEDMALLDSAFANAKGASINQIANKYIRKCFYGNNHDLKFSYIDSAVNLLQDVKINDRETVLLYGGALSIKGNLYFDIKNYDEAIRNFTRSKIVYSRIKDSCLLYGYYDNMANILYAQQKYLQAARFFQMKYLTSLSCQKDSSIQFQTVQENIDNVGICYFRANLIDSAIYYYKAALNYIDANKKWYATTPDRIAGIVLMKGVVYGNQADVLFKQKKYNEAEKLFLLSIESTKMPDIVFTRSTRLSLANMYIETNQLDKAETVIKDLAVNLDSTQISSMLVTFYKTCSEYYIRKKQPYAAHLSLLKAYKIKDSLNKRDRQFNAIDVKREFENTEQKNINEKLKKENELKNTYLTVSITGVVMGVIIILLVLTSLKRKSNYAKRLTLLNKEINQKNDELQKTLSSLEQSHKENNRILRVVAHDLKNPIGAIRTLVYSLLKKEQAGPTRNALELIESTCIDSINLIKDLLNNKRKLSDISKELVDMGRLIEQCAHILQAKAEEKKQQLTLQLEHPVVMLNRQKILKVINGIVDSIIEHSPEKSEITIRLERHDKSVLFSVKDNSGLDKIFMTETMGSETGAPLQEPGFSLSGSRAIIEEHDGRLWFENDAGKGSVLYVELPYLD